MQITIQAALKKDDFRQKKFLQNSFLSVILVVHRTDVPKDGEHNVPAKLTFGQFLKENRLKKDIMLRDFAAALGLSPEYICNVEKGRKPAPKDEVLAKIVNILRLDRQETEQMYDLAAETKYTLPKIPGDLTGFIYENRVVVAALRMAKEVDATDEDWQDFMDKLSQRKAGHKTGGNDSG